MIAWNKGKTKKDFPKLSNAGVKKGNIPWNKGKKYPAPWLEKYRFGNRSKAIHKRKEKYNKEDRNIIWGASRRGKKNSKAHNLILLQSRKGLKPNLGIKFSDETKRRMSEAQKKIMTPEHIRNCLRKNPKSSLEIKFETIINELKLPYKFVGNGEVIINKKNPDFVNINGEKIAIEVYYTRHKEEFRNGIKNWKKDRMVIFMKYGWKLLFFNELQVNKEYIYSLLGGGE